MNMRKHLFIVVMSLMMGVGYAQSVLNAKSPDELREQREITTRVTEAGDTVDIIGDPIEYGYVDPKDVIWSKVVWEVIDMNERLNQPYFHSSDGIVTSGASLYDALVQGVSSGEIQEVFDDEYFEHKMTYDQIVARTNRIDTADYGYDQLNAGEDVDPAAIFKFEIDGQDVKMVKIKGMWYIDRRLGEMKYRLLGLALMGPDAQTIGTEFDDNEFVDLFWIWYPDARKTLNKYTVFNPSNSVSSITFDDMLNARRFSSIIYKAQTTHGIREVTEYIPGDAKSQLEESNRIRESILQAEADMWHY